MGFLVLVAFVAVFIFVCVIIGKINDAKRSRLMNRINEIKGLYPLAFKKYISANNININSANNDKLEYIIIRSEYEWAKEERQLRNEEQKRIAIDKSYQEIYVKYPDGLKKWLKLHNNSKKEEIVANKYKIQDYQKFYIEAQENNIWEKEQIEYRNQVLSLQKKILPNEGRYYYEIPFQKINDDGVLVDGTFGVWQIFIESYCREADLDYSDFEYIKERTSWIEAFKHKDRFFIKQVYQRLNNFLIELSQTQPLSVYMCVNNKEWDKESLSYHYFDKFLIAVLPDNIEVIDPSTESVLLDEDLNYEEYPVFKNRHIVIIEMQTENNHLREVCKNIIDKNKELRPLITYVSFLKGYDREEMIELINREKKKKEEEAEKNRKKAEEEEKQKQKEEESKILSICSQYGIGGLYHMTHINNLASIIENGLLSHTKARKDGFMKVDIANNDVNDRRSHPEPIHNRPIHDYAPLYFNPHNPMLYVRKDQQESIIIIEFSPTVFLKDGVIFSDGNAAVHTTATYSSETAFYSDLNDLSKLNWACIHNDYWNDYVDGKRIKCAEVLVPDVIERGYITRIHYLKENPQLKDVAKKYGIELECSPELYF